MKILILSLFISLIIGCETTPSKKKSHRRAIQHSTAIKSSTAPVSSVKGVGGVLGSDENGILVSPAWMKRYLAREEKHGTIPADDLIWKECENYRVNSDVINHFAEMKINDSSLTP